MRAFTFHLSLPTLHLFVRLLDDHNLISFVRIHVQSLSSLFLSTYVHISHADHIYLFIEDTNHQYANRLKATYVFFLEDKLDLIAQKKKRRLVVLIYLNLYLLVVVALSSLVDIRYSKKKKKNDGKRSENRTVLRHASVQLE